MGQNRQSNEVLQHLTDEQLHCYLEAPAAELPLAERQQLTNHLATCAACRQALDELVTTVALLTAMPEAPLRRSFILTDEAVAAIGGPQRGWRLPQWVWPVRWATALVAFIFALTVGLGLTAESAPATSAPAAPITTTAVAAVTTPCTTQQCLQGFVDPTSVIIFPTPTVVQTPLPIEARETLQSADLRSLQVGTGLLALLGMALGFGLPAYQRRQQQLA